MQRTKIQYADYVSNPLRAWDPESDRTGSACVPFNKGCDNCWAQTINRRFGTHLDYNVQNLRKVELFLDDGELERIKNFIPRGPFKFGPKPFVFMDDMTDWLLPVYGHRAGIVEQVCATRSDINFLFLTKRYDQLPHLMDAKHFVPASNVFIGLTLPGPSVPVGALSNLFNIALCGWSTWISHEPALGPLDLPDHADFISFLACGGETGSRARPTLRSWMVQDRDWCTWNNVPFFFKQWGAFIPSEIVVDGKPEFKMIKRQRKAEGIDKLDGKIWQEMPVGEIRENLNIKACYTA
jgi:protein gp37